MRRGGPRLQRSHAGETVERSRAAPDLDQPVPIPMSSANLCGPVAPRGWVDWRYSRIDCLSDPNVDRASELKHPVQGRGGDSDLGRLRLVSRGS
jgi:hypothetical protein